MAIQPIDYDSAEHFRTPDAQEDLLRDAISEGDAGYLAHALDVIARARGMSKVATDTGVKRHALYRALDTNGNPTVETLLKMVRARSLKLVMVPHLELDAE